MFPVPSRRIPQPSLLRSHPPTEQRVARLLALENREMAPPIEVVEEPMVSMVGMGPGSMQPRYRFPGRVVLKQPTEMSPRCQTCLHGHDAILAERDGDAGAAFRRAVDGYGRAVGGGERPRRSSGRPRPRLVRSAFGASFMPGPVSATEMVRGPSPA